MDPKTLANMDPKLRETYERVMGTQASSPAPVANTPDLISDPFLPPSPPAMPDSSPSGSFSNLQPPVPPAMPDNSQESPLVTPMGATASDNSAQSFQPYPSPASVATATQPHGTPTFLKILYIFGGIIFFVLYTIFWMKVLNVNLPF